MKKNGMQKLRLIAIMLALIAIVAVLALQFLFFLLIWWPVLLFLAIPAYFGWMFMSPFVLKGPTAQNWIHNFPKTFLQWLFLGENFIQKYVWRFTYEWSTLFSKCKRISVFNMGHAIDTKSGLFLKGIEEECPIQQYALQLYHFVATGMVILQNPQYSPSQLLLEMNVNKDCKGLVVLEVGSGRGGGLSYVANKLGAKHCYGIDYSQAMVMRGCEVKWMLSLLD